MFQWEGMIIRNGQKMEQGTLPEVDIIKELNKMVS
jgi:hypothetical protein